MSRSPKIMFGAVVESQGPAVGPSYQRTYTCRFNGPDGPITFTEIRLKNARWSEAWDTLAMPAGTPCMAWKYNGPWSVVAFGPCETLADCGGGDGTGGTGARPRPGTAGGNPIIPPPGGGGGGTGTIGPSTGPPVGGGGFE